MTQSLTKAMQDLQSSPVWREIKQALEEEIQKIKDIIWDSDDSSLQEIRFTKRDMLKLEGKTLQKFLGIPEDLESKEPIVNYIDIDPITNTTKTEEEYAKEFEEYGAYPGLNPYGS